MNSRDRILNGIKVSKPEYQPLSKWTWESSKDTVETFIDTLAGIGANAVVASSLQSVKEQIIRIHGEKKRIVSCVPALHLGEDFNPEIEIVDSLEKTELAILEGHTGVAENGAIWIDGESTGHRVLPFICQHLVIVLNERCLVSNMHQAYERIDVGATGFGVFIAGPSKTADIEQSLVIGAHGARSLTVYLIRT